MKPVLLGLNWILLGSSVFGCLVAATYFILKWLFGWNSPRIAYWIALHRLPEDTFVSIIIIVPIAIAILGITRFLLSDNDAKIRSKMRATTLLLILILYGLLCGSTFSVFFHTGILGYREHLETVRLSDHIYHLHFYTYDESYSDQYGVYECDSLDILCRQIYSVFRTTGGIEPDVESIHLVHTGNNAIALEINGEIKSIPER